MNKFKAIKQGEDWYDVVWDGYGRVQVSKDGTILKEANHPPWIPKLLFVQDLPPNVTVSTEGFIIMDGPKDSEVE